METQTHLPNETLEEVQESEPLAFDLTLAEVVEFESSKGYEQCKAFLARECERTIEFVLNALLEAPGTKEMREQLIGEVRGMRRLDSELRAYKQQLQEQLKEHEDQTRP